ncbi:zinc finger protein 69 homolog [Ostrinia nubilalis]|uniref:zinc finger protein 69 homolog n=1 Tax=Ostrinia nubilalis TaxID=29057 RepID=UPI003082344D
MDKCRLCLATRRNVRSVFDTENDYSLKYVHMITSIANVKIHEADGVTDKICLACRKKLKEAYDFKVQIEKSDAELQNTGNGRKINFYNLKDIKIKVEIEVPKHENNIDEYFKDGETSIHYNDTIIKKVDPEDCNTYIKKENGPLSVLDFLNTIKEESENEFNDDYDVDYKAMSDVDDDDEEYLIPLNKRLKQKKNKKKVINKSTPATNKKVPKYTPVQIKPVYLKDLRVLPTRNDKPKIKKKYCYNKKKSMCNVCGKMTTCINSHILTHTGERSFKCEECGKGFLTANCLKFHVKYRHTTERNFKCDKCVATFASKEALKGHMVRHTDEKSHVCDICNKGFKRKQALKRHKLIHNLANKRVKCDLCNMSFFNKFGLNHHLRIHTGERPYKCEICSQPYSYKHDFNRHCFKKHGVFLKRRSVKIMNEEVLQKERELMRDLMLKINGYIKEGEPLNPFEGPQGYLAFEQAVKALQAKQIPVDFHI